MVRIGTAPVDRIGISSVNIGDTSEHRAVTRRIAVHHPRRMPRVKAVDEPAASPLVIPLRKRRFVKRIPCQQRRMILEVADDLFKRLLFPARAAVIRPPRLLLHHIHHGKDHLYAVFTAKIHDSADLFTGGRSADDLPLFPAQGIVRHDAVER